MSSSERSILAALSVLVVLQLVMLFSLYAGVPPHPPASTPLFGMGPFIGAAIAVALASIILGPLAGTSGRILCGLAAVLALVSFGPQKYFDAQIGQIWPAVATGQVAAFYSLIALFGQVLRGGRKDGKATAGGEAR